jgi:molybdopterin synthase sulfur carrier subunit
MSVTVRIPTPIRRVTNGEDKITVSGATLRQIIEAMEEKYPGIKARLCDDKDDLRSFVNIYINGEDVRFLSGIDSPLNPGDEVSIIPAVAGG